MTVEVEATYENGFKEQFKELVATWKEESLLMSSAADMAMLPSYQRIIGMGPAVVPFLLRELEREPDHWIWALGAITGVNPVPEASSGKVQEMAEAWLHWGREHGYLR